MNLEMVGTKLTVMARKIGTEKGPLDFLGLFLREDSLDLWDLVISAPWLRADERAAFEYVANKLREELTSEEMAGLSRIVILEHGGAAQDPFRMRYEGHTGLSDARYETAGGAIIRRAYIIVAQSGSGLPGQQTTKKPAQARAGSSGR